MKVGIVSDSHGDDHRLRLALEIFARTGVETIVHCGDIATPESVRLLGAAKAAVYLVAGNIDERIKRLDEITSRHGINYSHEVAVVPIDNQRSLAATHGHDQQILGQLILDQEFPYICHGHSHHVRDERIGISRIINPGALHRTSRPTVAILDTVSDSLEFRDVAQEPPAQGSHG